MVRINQQQQSSTNSSHFNIFGGGGDSAPAQSSNAFANGQNQNCGNSITDRSSTRLHQPPGGAQTFNIFGGGAEEAPVRSGRAQMPQSQSHLQPTAGNHASSNHWASGASQNSGNMLSERPSSRVLAPPGGAQTFSIFGGGDEPEAPARSGRAQVPQQQQQQQQEPVRGGGRQQPQQQQAQQHVSSNAWASGANQNSGNMLSERPSSRVLAPPGGRSSFSFGDASPPPPVNRGGRAAVSVPEAQENFHSGNVQPSHPPPQQPKQQQQHVSSNAWASNANQNSGNHLSERSSTRIHQPPGGKSSMGTSFAW